MEPEKYNAEAYWNRVAQNIDSRASEKIIAGDNDPYYRYKRRRFLKLLDTVDFENKKVLEVGSGPGGNLLFLAKKNCQKLVGVDISDKMLDLSKTVLQNENIELYKIDGVHIPFEDSHFDIVFTSTVLQHNTDESQLKKLVSEIARVSHSDVILFERIEKKISGHSSNLGRPVKHYTNLWKEHHFSLVKTEFLPIQVSHFICGAVRKLFNRTRRREGEPLSKASLFLEKLVLPITSALDQVVPSKRDVAMLYFKRDKD
jgi:ubiquinone/menaquinone biosynthesis C-methylase UbiE